MRAAWLFFVALAVLIAAYGFLMALVTPRTRVLLAIAAAIFVGLVACPDSPPGHVSIRPRDPAALPDWIASRGTGTVHPLTQELLDAIVGVERRPK